MALSASVPFNTEVMKSFKPSKTFRYNKANSSLTSLDFDDSGFYCLTTGEDESIQLYDTKAGKHLKTVYSKKYGAGLAKFTHHAMNCVYSSTKEDDTIRYLSLHDNHYIRYFRGHKGPVTALEVSPLDDLFLSSSKDHSVRVWDLRSPTCQGLLNIPSPSFVAIDAMATVFAVGYQQDPSSDSLQPISDISLYDLRKYQGQPFASFNVNTQRSRWTRIEFSNNCKTALLSTDGDSHYLFDSYSGEEKARLCGHTPIPRKPNSNSPAAYPSFSVDGRFVFGGSADNKVCIWDTSKQPDSNGVLFPIHLLDCDQGRPNLTAFSPKTMLFATADQELTLWLPDLPKNKSTK